MICSDSSDRVCGACRRVSRRLNACGARPGSSAMKRSMVSAPTRSSSGETNATVSPNRDRRDGGEAAALLRRRHPAVLVGLEERVDEEPRELLVGGGDGVEGLAQGRGALAQPPLVAGERLDPLLEVGAGRVPGVDIGVDLAEVPLYLLGRGRLGFGGGGCRRHRQWFTRFVLGAQDCSVGSGAGPEPLPRNGTLAGHRRQGQRSRSPGGRRLSTPARCP